MMQQHLKYYWHKRHSTDEISHCYFHTLCHHTHLALEIRHEFYLEGNNTGPHWHGDFYALYVVRSGHGIHNIDQHPYGITRGDVYILPPGTVHGYQDYQDLQIDACYFQPRLFTPEELHAIQTLSGFWQLLINREIPTPPQADHAPDRSIDHRLHLPPDNYAVIHTMLEELRHEFVLTSAEAPLLAHSLFFRLLIYLARWQASTSKTSMQSSSSPQIPQKMDIATIVQYCEEHFHEPVTVPQLAAMMFLSPGHFSELFSREVGTSPAAYIRRLRLQRAQTLLRTTRYTTTEIAQQVGFSNVAQFSRTFQAAFQISPTRYRATFT